MSMRTTYHAAGFRHGFSTDKRSFFSYASPTSFPQDVSVTVSDTVPWLAKWNPDLADSVTTRPLYVVQPTVQTVNNVKYVHGIRSHRDEACERDQVRVSRE